MSLTARGGSAFGGAGFSIESVVKFWFVGVAVLQDELAAANLAMGAGADSLVF